MPWRLAAGLGAGILAALLAACGAARAATLDVTAAGNDLVFTWDAPGPDGILRGTTPDNLLPWVAGVSSGYVATGENALRGENAFYRLASGSNMGFRIERTCQGESATNAGLALVTLPQRTAFATAFDLMRAYPACVQAWWWDGTQARFESVARYGAQLIGDDEALPHHGAVVLNFASTTTVTLVGAEDPVDPGVTAADTAAPTGFTILAVPPNVKYSTLLEVACGTQVTDWQDADGDGWPDTCGTDTNGDGYPDTGLFQQRDCPTGRYTRLALSVVDEVTNGLPRGFALAWGPTYGWSWTGTSSSSELALEPGTAYVLDTSLGACLNLPWKPPTW